MDHASRSVLNNPNDFQNLAKLGNIFVLASTFIGSPRHMQLLYQDTMATVRKYGRPDLFATMTCNLGWPEMKRALDNLNTLKWNHMILHYLF